MTSTRLRVGAAIGGFGLIALSMFGLAVAAQGAPPAAAATPSIVTPPNNSFSADPTPPIDIFVFTDTDSSVQVYADGSPYCTISPTGIGAFFGSCSGVVDLPLGLHTFTATSNYLPPDNLPAYESPASTPVNVTVYDDSNATFDLGVPATSIDRAPHFSGDGPIGGTILQIYNMNPPGEVFCTNVPIDSSGRWQCDSPAVPAVNYTAVRLTWDDLAGNGTFDTTAFNIVAPGTGTPTVPRVEDTHGPGWISGYDRPALQGFKSRGATAVEVQISSNGGLWLSYCMMPANGDAISHDATIWFCNNPSGAPMQLGTNQFRLVETNPQGESSALGAADITITMVEPSTITYPLNGMVIADSTPTFQGTAYAGASMATVYQSPDDTVMYCSTVPDPDGLWACDGGPFPDGDYSFHVFVGPGENVAAGPVTFTIDTTPPPYPVIATPLNPTTTADTTPVIAGSAEGLSDVTVWLDGSPACTTTASQTGTWACEVGPLPFAHYSVSASAADWLGNDSGQSPVQVNLTISPFAPPPLALLKLAWKLGVIGESYHPGDNVMLTGSGLPVGATAEAEIHSTPQFVGSAITDETGTFEIDAVIPKDIEPGEHTFVITVTAEGAEPSTIVQPVTIMEPPAPPKATADSPLEKDPDGAGEDGVPYLGDRNEPATPSVMTTSLDTFFDIVGNPIFIVTAGGAGLALLLFVAIPAELLNATLSEQYDRIVKRIPRTRATWWTRMKSLLASTPIVGGVIITALAAITFGFADPAFGFNLVSLRVVLACAIGLFFIGFIANLVTGAIVGRRWKLDTIMELKPLGLLLAIIGVVISRVLDFSPGLLIGLLIGISLLGKVSKRDESRTALVKTGVVWGLAVVAWIGYSLLAGPLAGTSFAGNLTVESMVAVTTEGLTALLIGLLPFKFLEGSAIWDHSKPLWIATWLGAAASWVLIVLPQNYGEIQGSIWVWAAVVAGFAIVALTIYLVFRFAVKPEEPAESENEIQKVRIGSGR